MAISNNLANHFQSRIFRNYTISSARPSLWVPIFVVICFIGILHLAFSKLNPDWFSYRFIYQSGGAWLSVQNRDPAFLALTSFLAGIFGKGGYEAYRTLLALYFIIFMALLSSGKILKINPLGGGYTSLVLALIYLGITRFTVQIREGLAISVAIFAIAIFAKLSYIQKSSILATFSDAIPLRLLYVSGAWSLLVLASLMHEGMVFVLLIAIAAWWATKRINITKNTFVSLYAKKERMLFLWIFSFFFAGIALSQLYLGGYLHNFAVEKLGDREVKIKILSAAKFGYWCLNGLICWIVYRESHAAVNEGWIRGVFASFLQVLSGPALMATFVSIGAAMLLSISPLFIVGYVRLLDMFLAIAMLCLAAIGRRAWFMSLVSIFLILDQVRTIVDSQALLFGVHPLGHY